ncbi:MAG: flagellar hook-basal body complex protein [bacterium]
MNDPFITAVNNQRTANDWIGAISHNLSNIYTPGFREVSTSFKSFIDGSEIEDLSFKNDQGKSMPGNDKGNLFLEGQGFFVTKTLNGKDVYTRRGDFSFDSEGYYKTADGKRVQGYILDSNGQIMAPTVSNSKDPYSATSKGGGPNVIPTTDIKMWLDPANGKYLGKYDEWEVKEDGILYGKSADGKLKVPLYKVALMNFNNPQGLQQIALGEYIETKDSGKPVVGKGEVRSNLIESSNVDYGSNIIYYKQAKMQMDVANKLIATNKQLLEETLRILQ